MNPQNIPHATGQTFHGLGIAPGIIEILGHLRILQPTPIQHRAIPPAIEGKDVVGVAQTGTGKTLAFGIPLLQRLGITKGCALILLPTRELALQVEEVIAKFGKSMGLRTATLIGGLGMGPQVGALRRDPHVVIATPGRLLDHIEHKTFTLNRINILVLDEADRMLDMGFWPQVERVIKAVPRDRQTMLFSATLPRQVMDLAARHMKLPVRIEVAPSGTTVERVSQEFFVVRKEDKMRLLERLLTEYKGSTIVFARTKHGATRVMRGIKRMGHASAEIHGNRSLNQRRGALEGFKVGRYRVLVATDIAARGLDVKGVELVLNFDLPSHSEDYVHRIGRTARAGAAGHAISFALPHERNEMRDIERLIRKPVPVSALPELPPARVVPPSEIYSAPRSHPPRAYGRPDRFQSSGAGPRRSFGQAGSSRRRSGGHARRFPRPRY